MMSRKADSPETDLSDATSETRPDSSFSSKLPARQLFAEDNNGGALPSTLKSIQEDVASSIPSLACRRRHFLCCCRSYYRGIVEQYQFASHHPFTLFSVVVLFGILVTCGVALCFYFRNEELETMEQEAMAIAEEAALALNHQLNQAVLPLFSLSLFVDELPVFERLEGEIGYIGDKNAVPLIPETYYRNISGICDDPDLVNRFNKIAMTLKSTANMDGVLVNLQLVPNGVICLAYPLNNTEDFPEGMFLDNTGAIGLDLIADPSRRYIVESALAGSKLTIAGPITLRQCPECHPTVKAAFIARLPISSLLRPATTVTLHTNSNSTKYGKWGYAAAIINWGNLVEQSGIYRTYAEGKFEFQLTSIDRKYNESSGVFDDQEVVLAVSKDYATSDPSFRVHTKLSAAKDEWSISVAYCTWSACLRWISWSIVASVLVSLLVALLVYTIFMQKQRHSDAIEEKSRQMVGAAKRSARNERELNDFIAHEVRNPISAALSACSFVSASINETEPLVDVEARKVAREDIVIIEQSLKYANDLLHSMLDLNRGNTNITVRNLPTDIMKDILEPVASMIRRRDNETSSFQVLIDCVPDCLVVSADRLRLKQIVLNLARNSSRYIKAGGFIRLHARTVEKINPDSAEGHVSGICLSVEDSGPGVPSEKRDHLFRKYQESSGGAGIGLSLCKKMADMMDGTISLDNNYDSGIPSMPGAKFDLFLRCECIKAERSDNHSDGVATAGADGVSFQSSTPLTMATLPDQLSVLFVDDDSVLRKLFARSIRRIQPDWSIKEACNGEAAVEICQQEGNEFFDVIFLDQYMTSTLLGTDTARLLRQKGLTSILCGLSANDAQEDFRAAGADFFMHKPFPCEPNALKDTLYTILTGPRRRLSSFTSTADG